MSLSWKSKCLVVSFLIVVLGYDTVALAGGFSARPRSAETGTQFISRVRNFSATRRESAILAEVLRGNVPSFLRRPATIRWRAKGGDGRWHDVSARVLPDYLAIGSDRDFVRVPMTPMTAQRIADKLGFALPTTKLVDLTYQKAPLRVTPRPLPAGRRMVTLDYYLRHNQMIESQRGRKASGLLAGHKKDIVVTNRLQRMPNRVAIYGWHRPNGRAIQPLSLVHEKSYADYSHGVRFFEKSVVIDGRSYALDEVMRDRKMAALFTYEGPMTVTRAAGPYPRYVAKRAPAKWEAPVKSRAKPKASAKNRRRSLRS